MKLLQTCKYCGYKRVLSKAPTDTLCLMCCDKDTEFREFKDIDTYKGSPAFEEKHKKTVLDNDDPFDPFFVGGD